MRLATPLLVLVLIAPLLGGCGGSGDSTSGSTGASTSTGSTAPSKKRGARAPVGASTARCPLAAGGVSGLRATAVSCGQAQRVALAWRRQAGCSADPGSSHAACGIGRYRCIGTVTARGLAVDCARPGHSIAFIAKQ